jgi:hypothetical protein
MVRNWVPFQSAVTFRSLLLDYIDTAGGGLYWALDDTDLATDLSGNGHDGTASTIGGHTATFPPIDGEDPSCTDLDGTDDFVYSSYNPFTNATTRTFMGWAYRDTNDLDALMSSTSMTADPVLFIDNGVLAGDSTYMIFRPDGSSGTQAVWATVWPGTTQWVFWVLVFDEAGDSSELFINGVSKGTRSTTRAYAGTPGDVQFGARPIGNSLDGKMAHVAVVEGGLTGTQIADLYTASGN